MIAGLDEAGRGPLAGGVYAAAVVLDGSNAIYGLRDSKKLSERKRIDLSEEIKKKAISFGIGSCLPGEIDKYNILEENYQKKILLDFLNNPNNQ